MICMKFAIAIGVHSDGFITIVLPTAIPGAIDVLCARVGDLGKGLAGDRRHDRPDAVAGRVDPCAADEVLECANGYRHDWLPRIIAAAPLSGYAELPCAAERPGLVPQLV